MANLPGVEFVKVNPVNFKMTVVHEAPVEAIQQAVTEIGYSVAPASRRQAEQAINRGFWPAQGQNVATVVARFAVLAGYIAPLRLSEHHLLGARALRTGEFDMNALMTIGVAGAMLPRPASSRSSAP